MAWSQIEATPTHLTYLLLSLFLISYVLFVRLFRNRLHLSEPPIALLVGILLGPQVLGWLQPNYGSPSNPAGSPDAPHEPGWGWGDNVVQEMTRIIVGIQCFSVGIELPAFYFGRRWKSIAFLLGPVMAFGWVVCTVFIWAIFDTSWMTAAVISATLTPTDPVLASSILSNSQFSTRIPGRIKHMLSAESGCNDGVSFPFLYVGLFMLTKSTTGEAWMNWFLITILWQCVAGLVIGGIIGWSANKILRYSDSKRYTDDSGFILFYLLLAILSIGLGATLGSDDFLIAFGSGYGFARDGWFTARIKAAQLPKIIDMMLNSAMFLYLGLIMPFNSFGVHSMTPSVTPGRLFALLGLVLLFRRIPIVLALYQWIPDIKNIKEALFCGHFGPMGLGALFLAMEARGMLERDESSPEPFPPPYKTPYTDREQAVMMIWPIVCFIVFGSTMVHGLSVLGLSLLSHFMRPKEKRSVVLAGETDPLMGPHTDTEGSSSDSEGSEDENGRIEANGSFNRRHDVSQQSTH